MTTAMLLGVVVGLGASDAVAAQPTIPYTSPAIQGRIVDERNGRGVAGAYIVAAWQGPGAVAMMYPDTVHLEEVISGADGKFLLPAWGPVALPRPVSDSAPTLLIYAAGYEPLLEDVGKSATGGHWVEIRLAPAEAGTQRRLNALVGVAWQLAYMMAPLRNRDNPKLLAVVDAEMSAVPDEDKPKEAREKGATLTAAYDWWREEFRRAIEHRALEGN